MQKHLISIGFDSYSSENEFPENTRLLMEKAKMALNSAYSPYSNFQVGAALRLSNGQIVTGSNQENAAYPSGMCAERTAFYFAGAQHPESKIEEVFILARKTGGTELVPACPCGSCRQAMLEYEVRQSQPIKVFFKSTSDGFISVDSVADTLPFKFDAESLGKNA